MHTLGHLGTPWLTLQRTKTGSRTRYNICPRAEGTDTPSRVHCGPGEDTSFGTPPDVLGPDHSETTIKTLYVCSRQCSSQSC